MKKTFENDIGKKLLWSWSSADTNVIIHKGRIRGENLVTLRRNFNFTTIGSVRLIHAWFNFTLYYIFY